MSTVMSVSGFTGTDNPEFKKHLEAVKFCIKNKLSYPKETSEFFKGKLGGDSLEDKIDDSVLEYIENGIEIEMPIVKDYYGNEIKIMVSEIPKEVQFIICKIS